MAVNGSLITSLDRTIVEDFGNMILDANFDIDPWSQNLVQNSMGVTKDGISSQYISGTKTGWSKVCVWRTGMGGTASWEGIQGTAPIVTGGASTEAQFVVYGAPTTGPIRASSTAPAYFNSVATLKGLRGSFRMPLEISRADQLDTNMAAQVGAILEGAARRVALREILAFWGEPASGSGAPAGAYLVFTAAANGTIATGAGVSLTAADDGFTRYMLARIQNSEALTIVTSAGSIVGSTNTVNPVFAQLVDNINLSFTLARLPDSSGLGSTPADISLTAGTTYYLFPYGSMASGSSYYGPTPLSAQVVNSGTVYNIALASHPEMKSQVITVTGSDTTPSEQVLNRYVGGHVVSKPASTRITGIVTTPGIKVKYVNNQTYVGRRDRFATPVRLGEGFQKPWDYEWDGIGMSIETSTYCPEGTMYGLRLTPGNYQKLTPPSIPGAGTQSQFGSYVDFFGNTTGTSIFVPVYSSSEYTDEVEAPFKRWVEFIADVFHGLKLSGFNEDIATT